MLIDTFRMRCEDDYTHGRHNHGIYGDDPPLPVFRDFLTRTKAAGMLPQWWNEEKEKECERMAMEDDHFNIGYAPDADDAANGCRKCVWGWIRNGAEADAKGLSVSVLRELERSLVAEERGKLKIESENDELLE
ncbi:MAG: hypothetical protein M1839_003572 [Geoglossum umbratile]|nr:MAG: hypothetical protein M1839_003572 [Geoglossum umbratile]